MSILHCATVFLTGSLCFSELEDYFYSYCAASSLYCMILLDSYGKPESGVLTGNIKWLGQYDECVDIQAPSKDITGVEGFRGKYCTLQVPLKLGPVSLPLSTAVCLPDSCNPNKTNFQILQKYHLN
ncbi:hypothetical protein AVEN_66691-1, partial [Araneus ventricosus]